MAVSDELMPGPTFGMQLVNQQEITVENRGWLL